MTKAGAPLQWLVDHVSFDGDECLRWPFSTKDDGYGLCWVKGKRHRAHRLMCEMAYGPAPSDRHEAAHNCGKGASGCCNPHHLEWKTPQQNQQDRVAHGTHSRGERQGAAKLTEQQVREMRAEYRPFKNSFAKLAGKYGVASSTAERAVRGHAWAHIGTEG